MTTIEGAPVPDPDSNTSEFETYHIVVNAEEQYSIWPVGRARPTGWTTVGEPGSRQDCLTRISELWTDMRPRSVRVIHG
ncbi:MbtH family protein [Micromonospora sp. NPDC051925]|uniref:MbtH family protein n=1 Tax=Micromonospora sp. NPDC051925 TaxID=3364288 RepID=UPI0037C6E047